MKMKKYYLILTIAIFITACTSNESIRGTTNCIPSQNIQSGDILGAYIAGRCRRQQREHQHAVQYSNNTRWLAEQGDAVAQYQLGEMYELGWGVQQDYRMAMYWFEKSAQQGYSPAREKLR